MSWVFSEKSKKVLQSLKLLGLHSIGLKDAKHGSMTTVFLQVTFAGGGQRGRENSIETRNGKLVSKPSDLS